MSAQKWTRGCEELSERPQRGRDGDFTGFVDPTAGEDARLAGSFDDAYVVLDRRR